MKHLTTGLLLAGLASFGCSGSADDSDAANDKIADSVPSANEAASAAAKEVNEKNAEQTLAEIRKEVEQGK